LKSIKKINNTELDIIKEKQKKWMTLMEKDVLALGDRNDTYNNAKETTRVTRQGRYAQHVETTMLRHEIDQNYESRLRIVRAI
jgi:hypothetical protein